MPGEHGGSERWESRMVEWHADPVGNIVVTASVNLLRSFAMTPPTR